MKRSDQTPGSLPKIGAPATRALSAAGYTRLEQVAQVSKDELLQLHGVGPKAIGILRQALAEQGLAFASEAPAEAPLGEYAEVNGIRLYYETYGEGDPLILLHGGLGMISMMSDLIDALSQERQVIGVDLQGHGRTADIDRPMRYEHLGDDIGALIRYLGVEQADVMGYSFGGGAALRTTIQYPDLVRKLVVVSSTVRQTGWYPEVVEGMRGLSAAAAEFMQETPMVQNYVSVAPDPGHFPHLLDKMADVMRQENDWAKEVSELQMPVMLVFGDADSIPPGHIAEFFNLLGGGQRDADWDGSGMTQHRLAILPGVTHYNIFSSPLLPAIVAPFLSSAEPTLKAWGQ